MKMKEVTATAANKMAHKASDEKLKDYKERLAERITKAANNGEFSLHVNAHFFCGRWVELKQWLESFGFVVGWNTNNLMAIIKWDDISIAKIDIMTEPKPAVSRFEFGWRYDTTKFDFVCSYCGKHSEYSSNYCPNCGVKTYVPNGEKERKYE